MKHPLKLPHESNHLHGRLSDCGSTDLILPNSDTYIPEFGLCLVHDPLFTLNEHEDTSDDSRDDLLNLSHNLQTPLYDTSDLSLLAYEPNDSSFGDTSFSRGYEDEDDILRTGNDEEPLNFNLDDTTPLPRSHVISDGLVRSRYLSAEDDDIQRIAREDHNFARQMQSGGWEDNDAGFGETHFEEYKNVAMQNDNEHQEIDTTPPPRKKYKVIVEDDECIMRDSKFRTCQHEYREMQNLAKNRSERVERGKTAKRNAENLVWGWGGRGSTCLPPALLKIFSRDALLKRWGPGESVRKHWAGKRKRIDAEVEYG